MKIEDQELKKKYSFDMYGRYAIIRDIINLNRKNNVRFKILDVGGRGNVIKDFLQYDDVYYLDSYVDTNDENYIEGNGCEMPLEDNSFHWVVSADVFEHIPAEKRIQFLDEKLRVAQDGVILVAPFYTKEVHQAEINVNEINKLLVNGQDHKWLIEHIKNGLPLEKDIEQYIKSKGLEYQKLLNNNLVFWEMLSGIYLIAGNNLYGEVKNELDNFTYFYNTQIYPFDSIEPVYRKIYFIKKKHGLKSIKIKTKDNLLPDIINNALRLITKITTEQKKIINDKDRQIAEQIRNNALAAQLQTGKTRKCVPLRNMILPISTKIIGLVFKGKIFRAKRLLDTYVTISRSGMFDRLYYMKQYKDIESTDPLLHYLLWGSSKGWNPNALFDTDFYLAQYPDVAKNGMNPLLHYIRYGRDAKYSTLPVPNPSLPTDERLHSISCSSHYLPGVSIIIPTYNGAPLFQKVLEAIASQDFAGSQELIVVDSGSTDGTDQLAERYGAVVKRIPKDEFRHSRTRQWALQFAKYDRAVYMVQDAVPTNKTWLQVLYNTLSEKFVAAYGRQIPHEDADLYARFETDNHSRYLGDVPRVQYLSSNKNSSYQDELYRCRFDNVCSIYWHKELEDIPFPDTPYAEDMAWAKTAMHKGMSIYYTPEIQVRHSHNRSPEYRFKRTIVDTVVCAKILNQVERDLRPAGISEIRKLNEFCERLYDKKIRKLGYSDRSRESLFKNTITERILAKSLWCIGKDTPRLISLAKRHFDYILHLLAKRYPYATDEEFSMCIPQAIAVCRGAVIGETYASYLLNGDVPVDLEEYVQPLMKGV